MHVRNIMLALGFALAACNNASKDAKPSATTAATRAAIREVSVSDVESFVKTKSATIVDANGPETRQEMGVVPGAVLLSSSHDYALSELPAAKNTKLVFYCGGTLCRASDSAAKRALSAGYADVSIMRAGIKGWKDAGQSTEMPRS